MAKRPTAEIVTHGIITALCIIAVAAGWLLGKVDSTIAIAALLALSGVSIVGKALGGKESARKVTSALPSLILAGAFGISDPPPLPTFVEVPTHENTFAAVLPDRPVVRRTLPGGPGRWPAGSR